MVDEQEEDDNKKCIDNKNNRKQNEKNVNKLKISFFFS